MSTERNNKLGSGERQVGRTLLDIRQDHKRRYEFAATMFRPGSLVLDVACGVGYGSWILGEHGHFVIGADISEESIRYAERHYAHANVRYMIANADEPLKLEGPKPDVVVSFETVEHIADPSKYLAALDAPLLLASVPNQRVFPWRPDIEFHFRHYTRAQFEELLTRCGWHVIAWFGQRDQFDGEIVADLDGWTLIALCKRVTKPVGGPELL